MSSYLGLLEYALQDVPVRSMSPVRAWGWINAASSEKDGIKALELLVPRMKAWSASDLNNELCNIHNLFKSQEAKLEAAAIVCDNKLTEVGAKLTLQTVTAELSKQYSLDYQKAAFIRMAVDKKRMPVISSIPEASLLEKCFFSQVNWGCCYSFLHTEGLVIRPEVMKQRQEDGTHFLTSFVQF